MWEAVGLSEPEERVYEALAVRPHAEASELADELNMSRLNVSRALTRLVDKEMATRLTGRPARYTAVAPERALAARTASHEYSLQKLREHVRGLTAAHRQATSYGRHATQQIEVIEGPTNIRNAFNRMQQEAQQQVRGFDRPPYIARDETYQALQQDARKIEYRVVYDRSALTLPGRTASIWHSIHRGERARVGEVPIKMAISDDRLALIPAANLVDAAYLVHPSSMLDALCALFEAAWDKAVAFGQATGDTPNRSALSEEDRELVALLAAGHTDDSIARTLGWNVRTVRRHIQHLCKQVGAQTRSQLGMQAARQEWF